MPPGTLSEVDYIPKSRMTSPRVIYRVGIKAWTEEQQRINKDAAITKERG